ncbi:MAG: hypothetical protein ABEI97_01160 [Candidatus Nanohaloarchaea archaeon]
MVFMDDHVVYAGGFPTNPEAHASTRSVLDAVDGRGTDLDIVRFHLDDDDDDDNDKDDKKPESRSAIESLNAALRSTDLSTYMDDIRSRLDGRDNTVGIGLCLGATVLAGYQEGARDHAWPVFDQLVLLDPVPGVETDHHTIALDGYSGDDAVAVYDEAIPPRHTVDGIPHLRTDGGGHLWQDVVDGFGDTVYRIARRTAGRDEPGEYAALAEIAETADGFAVPVCQEDDYIAAAQAEKGVLDRLTDSFTGRDVPGYRPSPGAD